MGRSDHDVLESWVPGSRVHALIHNPTTEGIDEGRSLHLGARSIRPRGPTPSSEIRKEHAL